MTNLLREAAATYTRPQPVRGESFADWYARDLEARAVRHEQLLRRRSAGRMGLPPRPALENSPTSLKAQEHGPG